MLHLLFSKPFESIKEHDSFYCAFKKNNVHWIDQRWLDLLAENYFKIVYLIGKKKPEVDL